MLQPCLFCSSECHCPPAQKKRKRGRPAKGSIAQERKAAVAAFVAEIEGRLYRAETDAVFSLEDWSRIRAILLGHHAGRNLESDIVRIPEESWEQLCDLLLVAEREKILASQAGQIAPSERHGPDRYLCRRKFPFDRFYELLHLVLPELFGRSAPEHATAVSPITEKSRETKVQLMALRYERGEAIHHPDDLSIRGKSEPLPDWLAFLADSEEVVEQTYPEKSARSRETPRLTLVGCCDEPEREFDFQESLKQKPDECERAARVCRVHSE